MKWLNILKARLRGLLRREAVLEDIEEELRLHLEMEEQANIQRGMKPDEARLAALRSFGNVGRITDLAYEVRGGGMLESIWQDLRFAVRTLRKNPAFSIVAVLTLALGIGANTAIFSVVNTVLLKPLPFKDSTRLVIVWETDREKGRQRDQVSSGNFADWQNQNQAFEDSAAYFNWTNNLTGLDYPERLKSALVTGSFFQTLGANAALGRTLHPDDAQADRDSVAVLSDGLWKRRFGASPEIVGKTITLNRTGIVVVGVMPPDFRFPEEDTDLWLPFTLTSSHLQDRAGKFLKVVARLKPAIDIRQAQVDLDSIAGRLEQQFPATNTGCGVRISPLQEDEVRDIKPTLLVLLGVVGFVLLIACANVANLLLTRAASRRKEMAVRSALGAGRWRLLRQVLTESLLLSLAGGAVGLLLAQMGVQVLTSLAPAEIPRLDQIGVDGMVLGFTFAACILTSLLCGLMPAVSASKTDLQDALKEGGRGLTGSSSRRLRHLLVVFEIALSLVLLVGAGLMITSFIRLQAVAPGFDSGSMLTMTMWLPGSKYPRSQQQTEFFQQVINRVKELPGVQSVSAIQDLPLRRNRMGFEFSIDHRPPPSPGEKQDAAYRVIGPDYFRVMGIPLIAGRDFTERDNRQSPPVLIINQTMARQYWEDENPIGKRMRFGGDGAPWYQIVGVAGDIRHMGLDEEEGPAFYQPHAQKTFDFLRWMTLVVQTSTDPMSLAGTLRAQVQALDNDQPVYEIATMKDILSQSVAKRRFATLLLGLFALVALSLGAVGIYGVLAFAVAASTREIGIRMALGARSLEVHRLVFGQGLRLVIAGVGLGLVAALALTRILSSLLFAIEPTDPLTFASIPLLLVVVAMLACWVPARRATKVDPLEALRYE
jgi:putative ABC transport system permease protein